MRILIVSMTPTHPVIAGNRKFILEQSELLRQMGNEIYFLYIMKFYQREKKSIDDDNLMKQYWGDKLYVYNEKWYQYIERTMFRIIRRFKGGYNKCDDYYPRLLHKHVNKLKGYHSFDAILVNYYFLSKLLPYVNILHKGLITHDYFAYKSILMDKKWVDFNLSADEEAKAMQRSPHIFALNDGEAEYFRRLSPKSIVHTIYCTYNYVSQPICGNHKILFLSGPNEYNVKGLKWFLHEVFPLIRSVFSDAMLILGGAICDVIDNKELGQGVELVGRVENLDDFYKIGDVAINPTYQGTGIKIKTIEAIAYGMVTLVHPHSTDGLFRKESLPVFASSDPEEWVRFLERTWNNHSEIERVKKSDEEYMFKLNKHIFDEYDCFLTYQ